MVNHLHQILCSLLVVVGLTVFVVDALQQPERPPLSSQPSSSSALSSSSSSYHHPSTITSSSSKFKSTSVPPLLDVPVYSLATLNEDGTTTNMNIVTYATPVATPPKRVWTLGLFKGTVTDDNIQRTKTCILQLLTKDHIAVVPTLGGTHGSDINKQIACNEFGLSWIPFQSNIVNKVDDDGDDDDDEHGNDSIEKGSPIHKIQVLPGCASYIHLEIQGDIIDAGSHNIAAFCEVKGMYECCDTNNDNDDDNNDDVNKSDVAESLSTGYLRDLGIITPQGRIAEEALPKVVAK